MECNLKAVALKAPIRINVRREEDAQRTAPGRSGEEHATPARLAWPQPGGVGA